LILLGDLFEFWFEYRHAIPKTAVRILLRLADLRESGVPVDFVGGNHDVWLADFLTREFGISGHTHPIGLAVGGRRVFAAHGDELVAGNDPGYRLLKRVLRNRVSPRLFALLHPDLGIPLGRVISGWSREHKKERDFFLGDALRRSIEAAFDAGHDAVVMGHLHTARQLEFPRGECVILGGWNGRLSIAELEDGRFRLAEWPPP
jgi:UDP-2,3-diacylglucosamine hydrolase